MRADGSPRASGWRCTLRLGLVVLGAGCSNAPSLPAGFDEPAAAAFVQQHEADVSAPDGPLAAVASHYVGEGQSLTLAVEDGRLVTDPSGPAALQVRVAEGTARCTRGCGPGPVVVEQPRRVTLDRFTLTMSQQSGALRVVVLDPQAPARQRFDGLPWFPVDGRFIVAGRWTPDPEQPTVELATSRGLQKRFSRAGTVEATLPGGPVTLVAFGSSGSPSLLIPLRDATAGAQTYPVGRYLTVDPPRDGVLALDFNRLTNPWCAYSEHYNCPIPPADNRVEQAITAGERYEDGHD